MAKQQLNTQQTIERLAAKFSSPEYGFLTQVRSKTGYANGEVRTADALAMSLWPSRGLHLLGFEVKVSRSDWLSELKKPEKAEEIAKYCHEWYMVFGSEDIFKEEEVPKPWGIIVPSGKGLKIIRHPRFRNKTTAIDHQFLAGIFRNVAEQCIPKETLKTVLKEEYDRGGREYARQNETLKESINKLQNVVNTFESNSGISMSIYGREVNAEVGKAVKMVLDGRDKEGAKRVKKLRGKVVNLLKYLDGEDISEWDSS